MPLNPVFDLDFEQQKCKCCGRYKSSNGFLKTKSFLFPSGYIDTCNDCLALRLDVPDSWEIMDKICQYLDIPFDLARFEELRQSNSYSDLLRVYNSIYFTDEYEGIDWTSYQEAYKELQERKALIDVVPGLADEEQKKLVNFEGVDATNYQSLKSAFDKIEGEVCITTEGLLMYLTDSEMDVLCDNIKKILAEHGGYWITLDPEMSLLYLLIVKSFYGERTREIMWQSKYRIDDKSDVNAIENTITISVRGDVQENMKNAMNYIKSKGFKLERLPYADHVPEFKSLEKANPKIVAQIREGFKRVCIWKITVDESVNVDISDVGAESFNADASIDGDRLNLVLSGNLDTLSAPELLANYEKIKKDNTLNSVFIDCSKLEYVSSAGLRVLLIMQNDCEDGVIMKSCNETVIGDLSNTDIKIL